MAGRFIAVMGLAFPPGKTAGGRALAHDFCVKFSGQTGQIKICHGSHHEGTLA